MPTKPGFYGVRVGKVPGVYETWDGCLEQVKGFSRARFKKFERSSDAFDFVNRPTSPPPSKSHSTPPSLSVLIQRFGVRFPAGQPAQGLVHDTTTIRDYPDNVRSDHFFNVRNAPTSTSGNSAKVVDEVVVQDQEITNKRRREQTEGHERSVVKETMTVRPTKRSRRHKNKQHPSSTQSFNNNNNNNNNTNGTALRDFFSLANYTNPTALSKLDAVGFGAHELRTMRGLQEDAIARRFRQLIGGGTSGSAAQVESLAFAVANVTEDAWNSLERYI